MNKYFSFILLSLLLATTLGQAPAKSWSRLVSKEGQFIVAFPVLPKRIIDRTEFFKIYTFEAKLRKETFGVSYFDAPIAIDNPEIKEQIYELGKKHHSTGQLVETKDISFGKHSGKKYRYVLRSPKGAQYIVKVYLVRQRIYQLDYYTANKTTDLADANKFFDSFELLNSE